ncbi:hypothetical protein San01_23970 [Streptomyces angustmyceticus]|uniref:Uncharacterized protein n=1 Tax=Streptomyces angustmyceticus TaxID=285578 RepID=A0A5J4LEH3_9ACTN|nr:hypothetical protein San01_23970 [Streptomyces angustmyceticus]
MAARWASSRGWVSSYGREGQLRASRDLGPEQRSAVTELTQRLTELIDEM